MYAYVHSLLFSFSCPYLGISCLFLFYYCPVIAGPVPTESTARHWTQNYYATNFMNKHINLLSYYPRLAP